MGVASQIISGIEKLKISEGARRGQNFNVLDWQSDFIGGFVEAEESALTVARGNGKTTLLAAIGSESVRPDGALFLERGVTQLVASSLAQARINFSHILWFMEPVINKRRADYRIVDNSHQSQIEYRPTGTVLKCLGSDANRAHGQAPALIICDEPAKWVSGGDSLYVALQTSLGKQPNSRMVSLGTKPEDPAHWFNEMFMRDDVFSMSFAADTKEDDP